MSLLDLSEDILKYVAGIAACDFPTEYESYVTLFHFSSCCKTIMSGLGGCEKMWQFLSLLWFPETRLCMSLASSIGFRLWFLQSCSIERRVTIVSKLERGILPLGHKYEHRDVLLMATVSSQEGETILYGSCTIGNYDETIATMVLSSPLDSKPVVNLQDCHSISLYIASFDNGRKLKFDRARKIPDTHCTNALFESSHTSVAIESFRPRMKFVTCRIRFSLDVNLMYFVFLDWIEEEHRESLLPAFPYIA